MKGVMACRRPYSGPGLGVCGGIAGESSRDGRDLKWARTMRALPWGRGNS